jgi:hypothetical protein
LRVPGTDRVAAIQEAEKGKEGEVIRTADGTSPVGVGPEIERGAGAHWTVGCGWEPGAWGDAGRGAKQAVDG